MVVICISLQTSCNSRQVFGLLNLQQYCLHQDNKTTFDLSNEINQRDFSVVGSSGKMLI